MESTEKSFRFRVKALPGASGSSIKGVLGDRIKVRINAPAENGKANKAILKLIIKQGSIKPNQIQILNGHTHPEKTIEIIGCSIDEFCANLKLDHDQFIKTIIE